MLGGGAVTPPVVTEYARGPDGVHVAYQVVGAGPPDLVMVPDWVSHLEVQWEEPRVARFLDELASFSRLVMFDRRGMGLSDPISPSAFPTLDEWSGDIGVVMDSVDVERAALFAPSGGSPLAILFAASHPDRVSHLILFNGVARLRRAPDYPAGVPDQSWDRYLLWLREVWGTPELLRLFGPSVADDEAFGLWYARLQRLSQTPGMRAAVQRVLADTDVRDALPLIAAPTLVLHSAGNPANRPDHARFLAEAIPDARLVLLPGEDNLEYVGDTRPLLDEIKTFLVANRIGPRTDRVLATVLMTDIVESTKAVADIGDISWKSLLDRHDELIDRQLSRYQGTRIKSTGDGCVATFDAPSRAAACALAIRDGVKALGLQIRAGLHTGEVEKRGADIGGVAVHIASRVTELAAADDVLASRTVRDLVAGSDLTFTDRGSHRLRGVPDEWQIFAIG